MLIYFFQICFNPKWNFVFQMTMILKIFTSRLILLRWSSTCIFSSLSCSLTAGRRASRWWLTLPSGPRQGWLVRWLDSSRIERALDVPISTMQCHSRLMRWILLRATREKVSNVATIFVCVRRKMVTEDQWDKVPSLMEDEVVKEIANRMSRTPAQVVKTTFQHSRLNWNPIWKILWLTLYWSTFKTCIEIPFETIFDLLFIGSCGVLWTLHKANSCRPQDLTTGYLLLYTCFVASRCL